MSESTTASVVTTGTPWACFEAAESGSMSWMRQEITEQPMAVLSTIAALRHLVPEIRSAAKDTRQLLFIARGSSDDATVYGRYLCAVRGGRLATLASPSIATTYGHPNGDHAGKVEGPWSTTTPGLARRGGRRSGATGMNSFAWRVRDAGADVYGIGGDEGFAVACRVELPSPELPEHLAPLALVVPGELLVEALARAKGIDHDRRRGLRKVTQTEERDDAPLPTTVEDA